MSESTSSLAGRIFISYRRKETGYVAGWLNDRWAARFGGGQVFKDVDSIQLGVWPCYQLANGDSCPDKWQAASFLAS